MFLGVAKKSVDKILKLMNASGPTEAAVKGDMENIKEKKVAKVDPFIAEIPSHLEKHFSLLLLSEGFRKESCV